MNYAAFFLNLVRLEQQTVRPVVQDLQTRLDIFGRSGNVVDVVNGLVSRRIGVDVLAKLYAKALAGFDHNSARAVAKKHACRSVMLENKVARLESIVEILKSAPCTPKAPLRQRLYAAEQLYGKYNVHVICDAFDIPRGTFYNHVLRNKKDNTWYAKRREELRLRIQEIFDESNQVFGAAKIAAVGSLIVMN